MLMISKSNLKYKWCVSTLILALILSTTFISHAMDTERFWEELSSPVQITPMGKVLPIQYGQLTSTDKENLISAKTVLVEFIKSFNLRGKRPLEYLHQPLKEKYDNDIDLFKKEFDYTEAILELKIVNFLLKGESNPKEAVFYASIITTAEGIDTKHSKSYALQKIDNEWKITRLSGSIKYYSIEKDY